MQYKIIQGHPNYCVSDEGKIYRLAKDELKEIKPDLSNGHSRIRIDHKNIQIARLVAEAFCPNTEEDRNYIFHIDGDKFNNRADNLCWMTMSEIQMWSTYTIPYRMSKLPHGVRQ